MSSRSTFWTPSTILISRAGGWGTNGAVEIVGLTSLLLGMFNLVVGVVVVLFSVPMARGKVSMNHVYGIRLAKSFESEENWDRMNRFGGRQFLIWGIVLMLLGVVFLFLDLDSSLEYVILLGLTPLLLFIPALRIVSYAKKL